MKVMVPTRGSKGRDRGADRVAGGVVGEQPGLGVLLVQVGHHLGGPVGFVHVVAVPAVVAVQGVAARPGQQILVEVAPCVEHARETQPARWGDRRTPSSAR